MVKKLLMVVLSVVALLGIIASPVAADGNLATAPLLAGQYINAGNVTVDLVSGNLTITYQTINGWQMMETHLYVSISEPTKSAPGRFPFKHENLGGVTVDTYTIPLAELEIDPEDLSFFVAAQAALQQAVLDDEGNPVLDSEGNPVYLEESAWAEGDPIPPGKNWAMYFQVSDSGGDE